MGGGVSRLEIVLDQEEGQHELRPLPAGSMLRGKVVVEVSKPLVVGAGVSSASSTAPPALELRLYGKEKVCMNRRKSQVTRGTKTKRLASKHAERSLLDLRLQWPRFPFLKEDGKTVPQGTYVFPFHVQLPLSLPSSMYHPTDDNRRRSKLKFRIQYKLCASIFNGSTGTSTSSTTKSTTATTTKQHLWIVASAPQPLPPVTPCIVEPVMREIKTGGGLLRAATRGWFLCGAALEQSHVQLLSVSNTSTSTPNTGTSMSIVGDAAMTNPAATPVHLHVACRNDSEVPVRHVNIQIVERCTWGTGATAVASGNRIDVVDPTTGAIRTRTTLQQTQERVLVARDQVQLPGLEAKEKPGVFQSVLNTLLGNNSNSNSNNGITQHQQRLQQQVFDDIMTDDSLIPGIQLPHNNGIRESYTGQLVQIQHLVRIEFQTGSGGGGKPPPVLELPLHILGSAVPSLDNNPSGGAGAAYRVPTETATTGLLDGPSNVSNTDVKDKKGTQPPPHSNNNYDDNIPVANAVAIPHHHCDDNVDSGETVPPADVVMVLGGDAVLRQHSSRRRGLMDLVPLAPPPSLPTLLGEMNASINDYELIAQKLMDESWIQFFQQLNADDVGRIMACVKWDQPRVALLLAPHLHQGRGMECADAAAAIQHALPQHRVVMVQRLLPVCVDAAHHHERVRDVLNDWEQTVTRDVWEPPPPQQQPVLQKQ